LIFNVQAIDLVMLNEIWLTRTRMANDPLLMILAQAGILFSKALSSETFPASAGLMGIPKVKRYAAWSNTKALICKSEKFK